MSERTNRPASPPPALPLSPSASAAHVIMFWVLTGMALAVFAPCVLVPIYQEIEQAREYRQQMALVVDSLKAQSRKNQARIDGLREDPLVNERIARRELNYRPEAEQIVKITGQELTALRVHGNTGSGEAPTDFEQLGSSQHWTLLATRWLPNWPYRRLFGDPNNRMLLMIMAGGLLVAAFVLYGRIPARKDSATKG